MALSVCPSVSSSHLFFIMFLSSYHEIFRSNHHWQKWCPCKKPRSEVKGQGQRSQNKFYPYLGFSMILMIFQSSMTFHDFSRKFHFSRFSRPCGNPDHKIWQMTLKNKRASFLCYFKLRASLPSHIWIQTGGTVRKCPIWVKIDIFFCALWPWNLTDLIAAIW